MTAAPEVHAEVEAVLERLNATPLEARFGLRSISVRHRPVEELLAMLEDMLETGKLPTSSEQPVLDLEAATPEGATGGRPDPVRWQDQLTLSADPSVNRILAVGERRLLDEVEALVSELDVHFPQVLIETLVLSLSESQTRDLGVELQKIGTAGDAGVQLASLFNLGSPDPAAGLIPPATGTGGVGVVLDPGEFSALVRALETLNEGRTLTVPKVLVNNNAEANLASVLQTPFTSTNALGHGRDHVVRRHARRGHDDQRAAADRRRRPADPRLPSLLERLRRRGGRSVAAAAAPGEHAQECSATPQDRAKATASVTSARRRIGPVVTPAVGIPAWPGSSIRSHGWRSRR